MSDDGECECGHVIDEHEPAPGGHPGECTVDDCPCFLFEVAPAEEELTRG